MRTIRNRKDEWLTPKEAARVRGTTIGWIYSQLWAARLPGARKVGRGWQIPVAAIHAAAETRKQAE
jgi:hypothetical protein